MSARIALLSVLCAIMLAFGSSTAFAESPTSISIRTLPGLAHGNQSVRLVSLDDRPLLLTGDSQSAWTLDRNQWVAVDPASLAGVGETIAASSDGRSSVLLTGRSGIATQAARVTLSANRIVLQPLAVLPTGLRSARATFEGQALIVGGIDARGTPRLFKLDLTQPGRWQDQVAWPAGTPAVIAAQNSARLVILDDGRQWRWLPNKGWRQGASVPGLVVSGSARAIGQAYLLYLVQTAHGATLFSYSEITDAWAALGQTIAAKPVTAVAHGDGLVWAFADAGQLKFVSASLKFTRQSLALIDWLIIAVYLFAMLSIGLNFYRRAKGGPSSEFFLGSRTIPAWAAGISMFAGSISSISYLAVPAKAFETDWEYVVSKLATICGLVFVAVVVVKVFRRLNLVSVFNYLERRFHPVVRLLSSALWILMQVGGRMGIVLFLPAMAIGTITDTNVITCIVGVGIFTIVYTALGGMRAVVWTDVFQVIVLSSAALFAIGFVLFQIGLGTVVESAAQYDKVRMLNFSFDVTQPTVWAFMILALFDVVLTFPKDQVLMQRVLATPSEREAKRSVWMFAVILLPSAFMFYAIGTVLFAYYRVRPERLDPTLPIDAVFPSFIGTELPHGIVGVIIVGLIAAAMGTLSGIINSVATLLSVDFYDRFRPNRNERQIVRFAEFASVGVGLVGIAIAIILSRLNIHSLLDLTIELFGLLGGACAGAYTLGLFTTRANWQGVGIGIIIASILTFAVWEYHLVHPYLYLPLAIASSIALGYLASLLFPPPSHSLEGLTIYSSKRTRRRSKRSPSSTPVS